jgi:hypothetical protein
MSKMFGWPEGVFVEEIACRKVLRTFEGPSRIGSYTYHAIKRREANNLRPLVPARSRAN